MNVRTRVTSYLVAVALTALPACTFFRVITHNFSGVKDFDIFPQRELHAASDPFHFNSRSPFRVPTTVGSGRPLQGLLAENETLAFLVIKGDALVFERYFAGHRRDSRSLSFSVAKSVLSILVGAAIDDGLIRSVDDRVTRYVPELGPTGFSNVKIEHLLQMTSGMDYTESDSPFGTHAHFYYSEHLEDDILDLSVDARPGRCWEYKSGDAALLTLILSRALGKTSITEYTQRRFWEPLGMEYDGAWSVDHEPGGLEKAWCCLAATARDLAKFGRLYLRKGQWGGRRLLSADWIARSTRIDETEGSLARYQYHWWIAKQRGTFCAVGHLGQYVYVAPRDEVIIVRLGTGKGDLDTPDWLALFASIVQNLVRVG